MWGAFGIFHRTFSWIIVGLCTFTLVKLLKETSLSTWKLIGRLDCFCCYVVCIQFYMLNKRELSKAEYRRWKQEVISYSLYLQLVLLSCKRRIPLLWKVRQVIRTVVLFLNISRRTEGNICWKSPSWEWNPHTAY